MHLHSNLMDAETNSFSINSPVTYSCMLHVNDGHTIIKGKVWLTLYDIGLPNGDGS